MPHRYIEDSGVLAYDIVIGAPADMDWKWADIMDFMEVSLHLDAMRFGSFALQWFFMIMVRDVQTEAVVNAACDSRQEVWGSLRMLERRTQQHTQLLSNFNEIGHFE